jgi:transmembrane sensor
MTRAETSAAPADDAFDAAAEWWYRIQTDATLCDSQEFLAWMKTSQNAAAFEAVKSSMATLYGVAATPKILDMRRVALARLHKLGVRHWIPWRVITQAAAAVLVFAAAGGAFFYMTSRGQNYATETGERRVVALSDGSRILLDTGTELNVRYTSGARTILLRKGRARFDVAHDVTRPFKVTAGSETVVAVGTAFNVEQLKNQISVTLLQGRVVVKNDGNESVAQNCSPQTVSLVAGQQLTASQNCTYAVHQISIDAETAWEGGHLVFRGVPLGTAVEQVNRYTDHPIVVDPSASGIKISGVFNAGDISSFVNAITGYFPVSATTDANDTIRLQRRS